MTGDPQTNLSQLRNTVRQFVRERDWNQFHSPKNLVMALSIEVAELMEHFQWISVEDSRSLDGEKLVAVGEEMADVFCYLMALANELDLDLTSTFFRKMELNRIKYPASEYRGRFGDGDPNPVQPGE